MASRANYTLFQALDANGDLLVGGKLYTYVPGTTTDKETYKDSDAAVPHANPIILDARGEEEIFLKGTTKFVLKDADDAQIWSKDYVESGSSDASSADSMAELRATVPSNDGQKVNLLSHAAADYTSATPFDGGGGPFYASTGAAAATYVDNDGTVIVPTGGDGSVAWIREYEDLNILMFGAAGDGVDDHDALVAFFNESDDKRCILPAGTYNATSLLSHALTGAEFIGEPGVTFITGAFGYAVLELLTVSNVSFHGITFRTDYVNAVEDAGLSVVYSSASNWAEVKFNQCTFSSPTANTSGLTLYLNALVGGVATCDGLWIEDCIFTSVGRIGCTLMNRSTTVGKTGMQRVYFNRNKGIDMGLSGSFGFLISLDGFGQSWTVNNNHIENALGIGLENTGWVDGEMIGNTFDVFTRVYSPIGFSRASGQMTGVSVKDNKTLAPSSDQTYFYDMDECTFSSNKFHSLTGNGAAFRNVNLNRMTDEVYQSDGTVGCLIESGAGTSKENVLTNVIFSTIDSASSFSCMRFSGSGTEDNKLIDCITNRGSGGAFMDEISSAVNNYAIRPVWPGAPTWFEFQIINFTADADKTLIMQQYAAYVIDMTDSGVVLTAGRNVILPTIKHQYTVINATAQILTFKTPAGTGVAVGVGKTAIIYSNGTNFVRATADV